MTILRHIQHISQILLLAVLLLGVTLRTSAQTNNSRLKTQLTEYFRQYNNPAIENNQKCSILQVKTDNVERRLDIYTNEVFGMQPFTPELVSEIYQKIRLLLPSPYNTYQITVYSAGKDIQDLVTAAWTNHFSPSRNWRNNEYQGQPWVKNISLPTTPTKGLQGRHLSAWASHGKYYSNTDQAWMWQRPHLYCTTEDLLTQSIAVPFLYPMLERAGAVVFTPRERDWQRHEVVVDNDFPDENGTYRETINLHEWQSVRPGFSNQHKQLTDFDDPHHEGIARATATQPDPLHESTVTWTPFVPEDGDYAVYVTYPMLTNAIPDARYTIRHGGANTTVTVNQQMGGNTWVYLGTYDFTAGLSADNSITLTNTSAHKGFVGADAIRLGGGMSHVVRANIQRDIIDFTVNPDDSITTTILPGSIIKPNGVILPPGSGIVAHDDSLFQATDSTIQLLQYTYTNHLIGSNLPRHLEAARYSLQWYGLKRDQFGVKDGTYDYGDDINARPIATNYLARGSATLPGEGGLNVPLELNLALHSDAGYKRTMDYIGSLAIHTSDVDEGTLPDGQSRLISRDLCDILLQQVQSDLSRKYGKWTRRQIYDRNYGETRIPQIPSAILEMFSHQNYADMARALDPVFKFHMARSIYKGILRYITLLHTSTEDSISQPATSLIVPKAVVEPLPVNSFAAQADVVNHQIKLTWQPTLDPLEPSAIPTSYIVYTRAKGKGWDNGRQVLEPLFEYVPSDSLLYEFRVEAVNAGGRSMPSETLCARLTNRPGAPSLLIMNGFQRLASPQAICNADSCGFDMQRDPGVPYIHTTEFCGRQLYFSWDGIGKETSRGMGHSGTELEGMLIKGNTFDYPSVHAEDFLSGGDYNISSCNRDAVEREFVMPGAYTLMDIIMGAQRNDGYSTYNYKTFTPKLQQILESYTEKGGALLVSGAYIGSDMSSKEEQDFTDRVLHYRYGGNLKGTDGICTVEGMGTGFSYQMKPNPQHLSTAYTSILQHDNRSFTTLVYGNERQSCAIAYKGPDYSCIAVGLPVEQIQEPDVRRNIMQGFLQFLLTK